MATYTGSEIGVSNDGLGDLAVLLNGTEGPTSPTHVTYSDDSDLPGVSVELFGTGFTGAQSSWNITGITITNNFGTVETITGITDVDGTPTTGSFDVNSLFQAEALGAAPHLLFSGNNNVINGGPGNESLVGFGKDGNFVTINANGGGNYLVDAGGGTVTVNLGRTSDVVEFNFVDSHDPTGNVVTVHGFNPAKDLFAFDGLDFSHISGTPKLLASEFHLGPNPAHPAHNGIWYNQHTGALYYDFFSDTLHTEIKDHVANIANHAALTAADFVVIA
jgi:hypothetical protein